MAGSKRLKNLVNSLHKKDAITISNLITVKSAINDIDKLNANKIKFEYKILNSTIYNPLSFIKFIYIGLRFLIKFKNGKKINIIYHYDTPTLPNFIIILLAKILDYKVILDIVEDDELLINKKNSFLYNQKLKLSVFLLKKSQWYADFIVVISDYLYSKMSQITENKIPIFKLPISVNFKNFESNLADSKFNKRVFYGGSFGDKDGIYHLLKAFDKTHAKYPTSQLILTGKISNEARSKLFEYISKLSSKEDIKFVGYLEDDEYYKLMTSCNVFCATRVNSRFANAGFPFKLGEMLSTGKPVIVTKVGEVEKYLINNNNSILIEPDSSEEIFKALCYIFENTDFCNQIGLNGKKTALKYFDSDKITNDFYNNLIKL